MITCKGMMQQEEQGIEQLPGLQLQFRNASCEHLFVIFIIKGCSELLYLPLLST
jgi:hypothetical protein